MTDVADSRLSVVPTHLAWHRRLRSVRMKDDLPENKARENVLRILLRGTTIITGLFFVLLLLSYFAAGNTQVRGRLIINLLVLLYLIVAIVLERRGKHQLSAGMLVVGYVGVAGLAAWTWGINLPLASLVMCVTITLAGIVLGARYALYAAATVSGVVLAIQTFTTSKVHIPDQSWQSKAPSQFGDAIGYCLLFFILGLVAWIFGRQIERSLSQAREAEAALLQEKKQLSIRLKERTDKLRATQLKEVQQLYRFAELGQMSTAMLHELANHLTVLTLDIEGLEPNSQQSQAIERAKQSISHLDGLVAKVSRQLKEKGEVRTFNVRHSLEAAFTTVRPKAVEAEVELKLVLKGAARYLQVRGDPTRFGQVMTILITNAVEASVVSVEAEQRRSVKVSVLAGPKAVEIRISDWGAGINASEKAKLFKPFYTTKENGMGIGLFITRKIIQTHFRGTVALESAASPTTFNVTLPHRSTHADRPAAPPHPTRSRQAR